MTQTYSISHKPYGLVLAGGGAKGAYQLGAWKAMRELGVQFSAISGVSIGAINGALIAADNFEGADELWRSVNVGMGVNLTSELKDPENLFSIRNFPTLFMEIVKNGGIDASPTKDFISRYIDEDAVRRSPAKLGIVSFHLSGMSPLEMFIDDVPQGQLLDYLLASCKVPGVNKIGPEGERYLDGGVYDNAPIGLLRRNGYNRIIIIDISSMKGLGHRGSMSNAEIVYIRPYDIEELGAAFEFDESLADFRIKLGYYDARKAFGFLSGRIFYFEDDSYRELIAQYGADACEQLECLAKELSLDRFVVYKPEEFLLALKVAYARHSEASKEKEEKFYDSLIKKLPLFKSGAEYGEAIAVLDSIII